MPLVVVRESDIKDNVRHSIWVNKQAVKQAGGAILHTVDRRLHIISKWYLNERLHCSWVSEIEGWSCNQSYKYVVCVNLWSKFQLEWIALGSVAVIAVITVITAVIIVITVVAVKLTDWGSTAAAITWYNFASLTSLLLHWTGVTSFVTHDISISTYTLTYRCIGSGLIP